MGSDDVHNEIIEKSRLRKRKTTELYCVHCGDVMQHMCYGDYISRKQTCNDCEKFIQMDTLKTLHRDGCAVLRNAFALDDDTLDMIRESKFNSIFNGVKDNSVTYDGKRLMATGEWKTIVRKRLKKFLRPFGVLDCRNGKKQIKEIYALKSIAGCPMQPKHADSAFEGSLRDKHPSDVPLAILYAIQANTKLKVWCFDKIEATTVLLQPRDLVIIRGDLAHAGYEYNTDNIRVHAYIDSTALGCVRTLNKTFIISDDSLEEDKSDR